TAQPTASTSGPRPAPEPAPSVAVTPFAVRFAGDDTTGRARAALLANVLRSDTSADLRRVAAWGLSRYRGDAAATTALVAALRSDRDAEVREMAAWALAGRDVPEARDA